MSHFIQELKEVLIDNKITTELQGVIKLDEYMDGFKFHPMKAEYETLTMVEKRQLVLQLLK